MKLDTALTGGADRQARQHLLQHFALGNLQEDLCFAVWRLSTGRDRRTALVYRVIPPLPGERKLHGNASFEPDYLFRSIGEAKAEGAGLAFMHSHPSDGWQGMSEADVRAEHDVLAFPAQATGLPLLGMTLGTDGYWSARFWERHRGAMERFWCQKVRVIGQRRYRIWFNDDLLHPPRRRSFLRRTYDTWGTEVQNAIGRLRVGIVGLGSVGSVIAETLARIGVSRALLIDPDRVEPHNLDRLLHGTPRSVGHFKVDVAARAMRSAATSSQLEVTTMPVSVHSEDGYRAALDCDLLFSCVDRPVARDVLNYIANAHLIPVVDGGVAVETHRDRLHSAHWRVRLVTPGRCCLRCAGQYSSSMVSVELDGSLDDPRYIRTLDAAEGQRNENVFPFSLHVAAMQVNLMIRYLTAEEWWPSWNQQEYQFVLGETGQLIDECYPSCEFLQRKARGDGVAPPYVEKAVDRPSIWKRLGRSLRRSGHRSR